MKLNKLMMTAAATAMIASGAIAQDTTATTGTDATIGTDVATDAPAMAPQFTSISEMTVGDLVGKKVYEPNGDTIGDIDYIVGGSGSADAVIGIGGFLGLGEYTVALPLSEFTYDAEQQMVKLDTTKDALKEQPEYDESGIESLPDETPLADLIVSADTSATTSTADDGAMKSDDAAVEADTAVEGDTAIEGDATVEGDAAVEGDATIESDTAVESDDTMADDSAVDTETSGDASTDMDATTSDTTTEEGAMDEEKKAE